MRHLALLLVLLSAATAHASGLSMVHVGYLLDSTDRPVNAPGLSMVFRLYNVRDLHGTGEQLIWQSDACTVDVTNGYYSVVLGGACNGSTPLDGSHIPAGATRYLEMAIAGTPMLPRLLLGMVPNAATAQVAMLAKSLMLADGAGAGLALLSNASGAAAWGQVAGAGLSDGAITDAKVAASAAIATGKLAGPIFAITGHGLGSLATKSNVGNAEVAIDAAIATSKLAGPLTDVTGNGLGGLAGKTTIVDADVAPGAAIATNKLSGPVTSIANHGLGGLATKSSIADADVAPNAAIAGTKVAPAFGAQDVSSSGNLTIGSAAQNNVAININGPNSPAGSDSAQDVRFRFAAAGSAGVRAWRGGSWDTYLQFLTQPSDRNADNPSVRMTITGDGSVGIGTTSPRAMLDVNGEITAVGATVTVGPSAHDMTSVTGSSGAIPTDYVLVNSSPATFQVNAAGVTVKRAGYYRISARLLAVCPDNSWTHVGLLKNGNHFGWVGHGSYTDGSSWRDRYGSKTALLAAGDVIAFQMYNNVVCPYRWYLLDADGDYTFLEITRVN